MISRIAGLLLSVLVAATVVAAPAHGQDGGPGWDLPTPVVDDAIELLLVEIAILHDFDAFRAPTDARLEQIHERYAPWTGTSEIQMMAALDDVDRTLAETKSVLITDIDAIPRPFEAALDEMPPTWLDRIGRGEIGFIGSGEYLISLDLLVGDGVPPTPGAGRVDLDRLVDQAIFRLASPAVLTRFTVADADDLAARIALLAESDGNDAGADGAGAEWVVVALLALVVLVGAALLMWRIRRRATSLRGADHELLDAHRRLAGSTDEAEIADIVVGAAVAATEADGGLLLRTAPDGLRVAGTGALLAGSILERIVETGQALCLRVERDPLTGGAAAAVAAVPVVADGRIAGALVVWRSPDRAFDDAARLRLEQLAPTAGGALMSADVVGSAQTLAMIDQLTSLGNRRRLDGDLETTLAASIRSGAPVAFAMIDIDHFKNFNDTHGHAAGDAALQTVARIIAACVRGSDIVYRYGGEEFSVLLPGATEAEAHRVAERVRDAVESAPVPGEERQPGGRMTVSIGIATTAESGADDLKERADDALYRAKQSGRNRVEVD